jgi:hypothetical protein
MIFGETLFDIDIVISFRRCYDSAQRLCIHPRFRKASDQVYEGYHTAHFESVL